MLTSAALQSTAQSKPVYQWLERAPAGTLAGRVALPAGFERVAVAPGSFGEWLRAIPVKPGKPEVMLFNGEPKYNQQAHSLVLDIDTGNRDLQQCADAVMRLRAEYLYGSHQYKRISFDFTNGFTCDFATWTKGYRPAVIGNKVSWKKSATPDSSYQSFRKYMVQVFTYAGTQSLSRQMKPKAIADIAPGDVFIRGGFPGHAVIVLDVAVNKSTGDRIFLIAQSYMPAQDMHVLVNPNEPARAPWYAASFGEQLLTPEWTFTRNELKTF
ncbi:MAG: DUF4846 domain-containing protein [Bacteroidia bacterium]|nr:DUF4846 domain-containing protein [Bacteroidia bacterium]